MLNFLLQMAERYGLDVAQLGVTLYLFWKLFCNHLHHIAEDLKTIKEAEKEIKKEVILLGERVSKVEGRTFK